MDGLEEIRLHNALIKARMLGSIEKSQYNVGDISVTTGLKKVAEGVWVNPNTNKKVKEFSGSDVVAFLEHGHEGKEIPTYKTTWEGNKPTSVQNIDPDRKIIREPLIHVHSKSNVKINNSFKTKYEHYRKRNKKIDKDNYHIATIADFKEVKTDDLESKWKELKEKQRNHFLSQSGSQYVTTSEGVYRYSDHWGSVASCKWTLDGKGIDGKAIGFCRFSSMKVNPDWEYDTSRNQVWNDDTMKDNKEKLTHLAKRIIELEKHKLTAGAVNVLNMVKEHAAKEWEEIKAWEKSKAKIEKGFLIDFDF